MAEELVAIDSQRQGDEFCIHKQDDERMHRLESEANEIAPELLASKQLVIIETKALTQNIRHGDRAAVTIIMNPRPQLLKCSH